MKPRLLIPALIVIFLTMYPLSLGPVIRLQTLRGGHLARNFHTGRIFFPHFYDPLASLCDHVSFIQGAMSWYLDLWVGDYPPEKTRIL